MKKFMDSETEVLEMMAEGIISADDLFYEETDKRG